MEPFRWYKSFHQINDLNLLLYVLMFPPFFFKYPAKSAFSYRHRKLKIIPWPIPPLWLSDFFQCLLNVRICPSLVPLKEPSVWDDICLSTLFLLRVHCLVGFFVAERFVSTWCWMVNLMKFVPKKPTSMCYSNNLARHKKIVNICSCWYQVSL